MSMLMMYTLSNHPKQTQDHEMGQWLLWTPTIQKRNKKKVRQLQDCNRAKTCQK